jgi:hypothetical protein
VNARGAAPCRRAAVLCTLLVSTAVVGACSRMVIGRDRPRNDAAEDIPPSDAPKDDGMDTPPTDQFVTDADADAHADAHASGDLAATTDTAAPPPIGIIGGRISMSSSAGVRGAGVTGVRITLTGPAARSALSDANGAYAFPGLPPGSYALALAKDGAAFTPAGATVVVGGGGADAGTADSGTAAGGVVVSFTCTAPCGTGPAIDPARELYVIDSSVIADARASNATGGPWSFRYLMEQAAISAPNLFAEIWIANLEASGRSMAGLRVHWPTVVDNTQALPDLSRAPFALLAIVNGLDAHSSGQGEARLVYGIYDNGNNNSTPQLMGMAQQFTVMFRYALPATAELPTRQAWAARFHELGTIPFGPDYNSKLQALTDLFTRVGARPSSSDNPRGSALTAVDIDEAIGTNTPSELRESQLRPDPVRGGLDLMVTTLEQTPDASLNAIDGPLPDFLNANAVLVQTGLATLPAALLGTRSSAFSPAIPWSFPSVTSEPLRHAFAGQTCVGCHSSEAPSTTFTVYHIVPYAAPLASALDGYLPMVEIPRRVSFMQNQLTCAGAACALGAEPMMGPAR